MEEEAPVANVPLTQVALLLWDSSQWSYFFPPQSREKCRVLKGQFVWMARNVKVTTFPPQLSSFIKLNLENLDEAKEKGVGRKLVLNISKYFVVLHADTLYPPTHMHIHTHDTVEIPLNMPTEHTTTEHIFL